METVWEDCVGRQLQIPVAPHLLWSIPVIKHHGGREEGTGSEESGSWFQAADRFLPLGHRLHPDLRVPQWPTGKPYRVSWGQHKRSSASLDEIAESCYLSRVKNISKDSSDPGHFVFDLWLLKSFYPHAIQTFLRISVFSSCLQILFTCIYLSVWLSWRATAILSYPVCSVNKGILILSSSLHLQMV